MCCIAVLYFCVIFFMLYLRVIFCVFYFRIIYFVLYYHVIFTCYLFRVIFLCCIFVLYFCVISACCIFMLYFPCCIFVIYFVCCIFRVILRVILLSCCILLTLPLINFYSVLYYTYLSFFRFLFSACLKLFLIYSNFWFARMITAECMR